MNPEQAILLGVKILRPIFAKHGFEFVEGASGNGSDGPFASGFFQKENRKFGFHYRYGIGLVEYRVGLMKLSHQEFLQAQGFTGQYPGYENDAESCFERLKSDLENHGSIFFNGSEGEFSELTKWFTLNPPKKGFSALKN